MMDGASAVPPLAMPAHRADGALNYSDATTEAWTSADTATSP
jgi:hypothetical protein